MAAVGPDNQEVAADTEEDVESGSNGGSGLRGRKDSGGDSSFGKKYVTCHKQKVSIMEYHFCFWYGNTGWPGPTLTHLKVITIVYSTDIAYA